MPITSLMRMCHLMGQIACAMLLSWMLATSPLYAEEPLLRVGISADYPPFEYHEDDAIKGFDIDLIHAIGKEMGYRIRLEEMDYSALIPALQSHKIDAIISGMNPTEERKQSVGFSDIYHYSALAIISRATHPVRSPEEFDRHVIAIQLGSSFEPYIDSQAARRPGMKVIKLGRIPQLVEELKLKRVDAVIVDSATAPLILGATSAPLTSHIIQDATLGALEGVAIAMRKEDPLLATVNAALARLEQKAVLSELRATWFDNFVYRPQPHYGLYIMKGIGITVLYAALALLCGFTLALPLAMAKIGHAAIPRYMAVVYTSIFRGTPLLVQLSIVYFGVPALSDVAMSGFAAALITFSLNSAAYVSEIVVGGIRALDKGQYEAATVLGISRYCMMKDIILPQAIHNVMPSLLNEGIDLLKESSLVSIIGEADIMRRAQIVSAKTYAYLGPLLIAAACYYGLVCLLGLMVKLLSRYRYRYD